VARLESLGMSVHEVAPLRDVDTWEDALAVAAEVPDARFGAAVTSVASSSMGSSKR